MDALFIFLFGFVFPGLVVWGLICNQRTYRKRMELIDNIYTLPEWQVYSVGFKRISYEQHMWALFFFQDPKKLYSPLIQEIW